MKGMQKPAGKDIKTPQQICSIDVQEVQENTNTRTGEERGNCKKGLNQIFRDIET